MRARIKAAMLRRTWEAQSVKHPTLDFSSGHDLAVQEIEPQVRLHADKAEPAWESLSVPPLPFKIGRASCRERV